MSSIRSTQLKKSRRNRECYNCGRKILKGEKYVLREERYDKKILSFYYHNHAECYNINSLK